MARSPSKAAKKKFVKPTPTKPAKEKGSITKGSSSKVSSSEGQIVELPIEKGTAAKEVVEPVTAMKLSPSQAAIKKVVTATTTRPAKEKAAITKGSSTKVSPSEAPILELPIQNGTADKENVDAVTTANTEPSKVPEANPTTDSDADDDAPGDDLNFETIEDENRYHKHFAGREVLDVKAVDKNYFQIDIHMDLGALLGNWGHYVFGEKRVMKEATKIFYSNMEAEADGQKKANHRIRTYVGGKHITVDPNLLGKILGIPARGPTTFKVSTEDAMPVILEGANFEVQTMRSLSTNILSARQKIVHRIILQMLMPRSGSHSIFLATDAKMLWHMIKKEPLNLPAFIIQNMKKAHRSDKLPLVHGDVITLILRHFHANLQWTGGGVEGKKVQPIGKKTLALMGYSEEEHDQWVIGKERTAVCSFDDHVLPGGSNHIDGDDGPSTKRARHDGMQFKTSVPMEMTQDLKDLITAGFKAVNSRLDAMGEKIRVMEEHVMEIATRCREKDATPLD